MSLFGVFVFVCPWYHRSHFIGLNRVDNACGIFFMKEYWS